MATVIDSLAQTAFRVFHTVLGDNTPWEQADPMEGAVFERLALQAEAILQNLEGQSAKHMAAEMFDRRNRWLELPEAELSDQPLRTQLAWEALTRYLFQVVDADGDLDDLAEAESYPWKQWADNRLKGTT